MASITLGSTLLIRALAATVLGGVTNLRQVAVAGVVIGVLKNIVSWNYPTSGALDLVLLVLILLSMFMRRDLGRAARAAEESSWSLGGVVRPLAAHLAAHPTVRHGRYGLIALGAAVAVLAPVPFESSQRVLLSSMAIFVVMGLSLTVPTGYAGEVSLGQSRS